MDLTTLAGLAAATAVVVQVILTTANLSDTASSRFGPLLALSVAVLLSVLHTATATTGPIAGQALIDAVTLGLAAGSSAMGIHNVVTKSALGAVAGSALGVTSSPAATPAAPVQPAVP